MGSHCQKDINLKIKMNSFHFIILKREEMNENNYLLPLYNRLDVSFVKGKNSILYDEQGEIMLIFLLELV